MSENSKLGRNLTTSSGMTIDLSLTQIIESLDCGIFVIGNDGVATPISSPWIRSIFPELDTEKFGLIDLLTRRGILTAEQLMTLSSTILMIVGEDALGFQLNQHVLPTRIAIKNQGRPNMVLDLDWSPVVNNDVVSALALTLRDATTSDAKRAEAERNELELSILNEVMKVDASTLDQFLKSSEYYVTKIKERVKVNYQQLSNDDVVFIRRLAHTIKGNARAAKLQRMATLMHESEEIIYRNTSITSMATVIEKIRNGLDFYVDWQARIIQRAVEAVTEIEDKPKTIGNLFSQVINDHADLAKDSGVVRISGRTKNFSNLQLQAHIWGCLRDAMTHVVRNTIDHGLKNYTDSAEISLDVQLRDNLLILFYEDHGRGLNLNKLASMAPNPAKVTADFKPIDVARMIFQEGVSTAEALTQTSGRGSGMGAARELLETIGGSIDVELRNEKSPGIWDFCFVIEIPN